MQKINLKCLIWFLALLIIFPCRVLASTTNGTIDPTTSHYAWSEKFSWINFLPDQGDIQITDGAVTGYAWGQNIGWINLSPTNSGQGVINDGEGHLSGFAWGANVGWIDFQNVVISPTGKFTGSASGTLTGAITFDCDQCDVRTDWRPASVRPVPGISAEPEQGSGGWYHTPSPVSATTSEYAAPEPVVPAPIEESTTTLPIAPTTIVEPTQKAPPATPAAVTTPKAAVPSVVEPTVTPKPVVKSKATSAAKKAMAPASTSSAKSAVVSLSATVTPQQATVSPASEKLNFLKRIMQSIVSFFSWFTALWKR